jgi:hypothetical protein
VKGSTGHGILKKAAEEKRYGPSGAVTAEWSVMAKRDSPSNNGVMLSIILIIILILNKVPLILCTYRWKQYVLIFVIALNIVYIMLHKVCILYITIR